MPLTTVVIFFYYGMTATEIFSGLKFIIVTLTLLVSYIVIIIKVKNSNSRMKSLQDDSISLLQQERTLIVIFGYILTLRPFTSGYAIEIYSFYNEEFKEDNELFVYTFRSAGK